MKIFLTIFFTSLVVLLLVFLLNLSTYGRLKQSQKTFNENNSKNL